MRCWTTSWPPTRRVIDEREAEDELERGPEHGHEAGEEQAAADVLLVGGFEGGDLGFFLGEGADEAGAGEVLLGLGGDVGEHGLDALEAGVDAGAEVLDEDGGEGQRDEGEEASGAGLMRSMKGSAAAVKTMVLAEYMMAGPRSWRTALRSLVVRAMMSPVRWRWKNSGGWRFEVGEEVVAEVELDLAGGADDDLAGEVEEDGGDDGDGKQAEGVVLDLGGGEAVLHVLDGVADEQRDHGLGGVVDDERETAPGEAPPVAAEVGEERSEAGEHKGRD